MEKKQEMKMQEAFFNNFFHFFTDMNPKNLFKFCPSNFSVQICARKSKNANPRTL